MQHLILHIGQGSTKISKINENLFDEIFRYGSNSVEAGNTFTFNKNNISCRKETEYIFSTNLDTSIYKYGIFINKEKFPNNNESEYNSGWIVDNLKKFNPTIDGYIGIQITRRDGTSFSLEDLSNYWFLLKIGNTSTDYIKHQQTDYILPIQQEMLSGDYFVKEGDGWKEVHNYPKVELTGEENISLVDTVDGIAQFEFTDLVNVAFVNSSTIKNALSNYFKGVAFNNSWTIDNSITISGNLKVRIMTSECTTVEDLKQLLQEKYNEGNPVYIIYKTTTPTKLPCTPEQSAVLDELSNLDLFNGVNNIITAENIAKLKLKYVADTKTYVDNQINQKLANINQVLIERS